MMSCGNNHGKNFRTKRFVFIPIAIVAGVALFSWVVMLLWNGILPAILGISAITYCQALGILVLSKILFGGFRCGHGHGKFHQHASEMHSRWLHMSPEEREKMKTEWKGQCCEPAKKD